MRSSAASVVYKREVLHNMSWETRGRGERYYTRSRRENGRVVREYVGRGPVAELAAEHDARCRLERDEARRHRTERHAADAELDRAVAEADEVGELLARLALVASGYHRHHGGEWRRRRGPQDE